MLNMTQKELTDLGYKIVGCAIEVHKHLGPGLLEAIYEECFIEELRLEGLKVVSQEKNTACLQRKSVEV